MQPQLNIGLAQARHEELLDQSSRRRRAAGWRRRRRGAPPPVFWHGLTLRLATSADRSALAYLAELEQTTAPADPVLVGVMLERPVAALSLRDGRVIADPFSYSAEIVELLHVRARQLSRA